MKIKMQTSPKDQIFLSLFYLSWEDLPSVYILASPFPSLAQLLPGRTFCHQGHTYLVMELVLTQLGHSSYTVRGTRAGCWRQGKGMGPLPSGAHRLLGARPGCRSQRCISTTLRWMEGQGARGEPSSGPEVTRARCPLGGRGTCSTLE